jgi:UDP-N-acetylglucosamine 2-epimerase (non-hydrolysing)
MAPLILALSNDPRFESKLCSTGQHKEMLYSVLDFFEIAPDYELSVMKSGQTLNDVTAKIVVGLKPVIEEFKPDVVIVHGDTCTTLSASLAAYYNQVSVAHVEAGLRTYDIYSPWPEEGNRKLTAGIASLHLAPTEQSKDNLLKEGIASSQITVTGNTVIDSLLLVKDKITKNSHLKRELATQFPFLAESKRMVLVTGHRRENFGEGFRNICESLKQIAQKHPDVNVVYPVHLNPNVNTLVRTELKGINNIFLIPPLDYLPFVYLMGESHIILTDSGGIQEEAPSLGKPVLVMRDTTERPEAVTAGTVKLVGTDVETIVSNVDRLLDDEVEFLSMSDAINPYGDGMATGRIIDALLETKTRL